MIKQNGDAKTYVIITGFPNNVNKDDLSHMCSDFSENIVKTYFNDKDKTKIKAKIIFKNKESAENFVDKYNCVSIDQHILNFKIIEGKRKSIVGRRKRIRGFERLVKRNTNKRRERRNYNNKLIDILSRGRSGLKRRIRKILDEESGYRNFNSSYTYNSINNKLNNRNYQNKRINNKNSSFDIDTILSKYFNSR